jgi:hypothetical protein
MAVSVASSPWGPSTSGTLLQHTSLQERTLLLIFLLPILRSLFFLLIIWYLLLPALLPHHGTVLSLFCIRHLTFPWSNVERIHPFSHVEAPICHLSSLFFHKKALFSITIFSTICSLPTCLYIWNAHTLPGVFAFLSTFLQLLLVSFRTSPQRLAAADFEPAKT